MSALFEFMENPEKRIILTGFMGVGKSSVARHLAALLRCKKADLDYFIEEREKRSIAEIIKTEGEPRFRQMETAYLRKILAETDARVIALGGGAWTIEENRKIIRKHDTICVWLESNFEHCWRNIKASRRERPIAGNKRRARELFAERERYYCLADWHFIVKPGFSSFEVARHIAEQIV